MATTADSTRVGYGRRILGGAVGNARLTALSGAVLLVLLAVEGATIPFLGALLSVHIFVGMLLLGPVALKLASTGYRFARYYTRTPEYVEAGPPAPLMRVLVAPVLVISTVTLFTTGVLLIVSPQRGTVLGLHKASFIVWVAACGIHVLAYGLRTVRELLEERLAGGGSVRVALVVAVIAAGVAVAFATYPLAGPWLHGALGHHDH
jgi:hypothetical protein